MSIRLNDPVKQFNSLYGTPKLRAVVVETSGTPKDNTTTSGGASVTYTFLGGELVLLQGTAPFYFEVIAAASMTASGAKSVYVDTNQPFYVMLKSTDTKISIDAVTGSVTVKMFEMDGV